jgi:hypothetical protein
MAKQGSDKITRFIVIGMVALVVIVGVFFSMNSGSKKSALPVIAESANGYAISFNPELKGAPVVDIWEDFQCPVCQRFEGTNGAWLQKQIAAKTIKVSFHYSHSLDQNQFSWPMPQHVPPMIISSLSYII